MLTLFNTVCLKILQEYSLYFIHNYSKISWMKTKWDFLWKLPCTVGIGVAFRAFEPNPCTVRSSSIPPFSQSASLTTRDPVRGYILVSTTLSSFYSMPQPFHSVEIYKSQLADHFIMFRFPTPEHQPVLRLNEFEKTCVVGKSRFTNFRKILDRHMYKGKIEELMSIHVFSVHRTRTRQRSR